MIIPVKRDRRAVLGLCLLLAVMTLGVFGQTVNYDFVNFDDGTNVYENPRVIGGLRVSAVIRAFTEFHAANWIPLTSVSYMLDAQLYGLWPGGYHLTNVVLHTATAVLLLLVLARMTGALWPSAFVAMVFAIHPLRVESVAWVSERKDVLSGLFFVLTIGAYALYTERASLGRFLMVVLAFGLGLMAKPMLVTLPFVLLLLDWWPLGRWDPLALVYRTRQTDQVPRGHPSHDRVVYEKAPLFVLAAASCVVTLMAQRPAMAPAAEIPFSSRLANAAVAYVDYVGQTFYPAGLAVLYPHPGSNLPVAKVAWAVLLLCGITTATIVYSPKRPYLLVGWLWYLGMLVPVIGLVQVGNQATADRYTYLPQIGLTILITWAAADVVSTWRYRRLACAAAATLVAIALLGCTWRQTTYWRDSKTLWNRTLACTSPNAVAHNNLGIVLNDAGEFEQAVKHYREALVINPKFVPAYNNWGNLLFGRGQAVKAVEQYKKALAIDPYNAGTQNNWGTALARLGQAEQAFEHFREALVIDPKFADAHNNYGSVLAMRGQAEQAIEHFREALALEPSNAAFHINCGKALLELGQAEPAVEHFREASATNPSDALAHYHLGVGLVQVGQLEQAIDHFKKALDVVGPRQQNLAQEVERRLELYQTGQP